VRRVVASLLGLVVAVLALGAFAPAVRAQDLPIPPPPEEAEVVLQIVSPIVSPTCANAGLAVVLVPSLLASSDVPVPSEVLRLFGPVVTVCGFFPAPGQRIACPVDDTLSSLVAQLTVGIAGQALPVDVRVVGPLIETLNEITGLVAGHDQPIAADAVGAIGCREVDAPPPTDDGGKAIDEIATPPPTLPVTPGAGLPQISVVLEPGRSSAFPAPAGPAATPVELPASATRLAGFDYPVAFAIPLVLLALAAFLGWTFARPVDPGPR
jgi:hypothetical protein